MKETDFIDLVQSTLKPALPRPAFVADLKNKLVRDARMALEEEAVRRQHQWIMLAAGVGGLVYVTGMFAVGLRLALWAFGLIAMLLGWRKRETVARVVRP